ncbi:uncharacterized protein AMSG_09623 [Thecamonas trahens ATCC 50062]|uniref:Uncharacterized protein n=1 Tax=Thecamonas trahens ATCC 50062 TaxID=461836 RepID=A0A0L0DNY1_THETB|nr:hypothetical protein AMSG_09623 [Thecamonas trahens ATCC 50062]KNC53975.1 hypothetical protein AMSG_09623 [Thecamonas trahens ATCC 50062]|eukprot:XP_013754177.1 hypothetical protein AMSG_09623 [Thecamonas trahens ATCC 50062]
MLRYTPRHIGFEAAVDGPQLVVEASFNGFRAASQPVPAAVEPGFDTLFELPLPAGPPHALLHLAERVHIAVVRVDPQGVEPGPVRTVIGAYDLEWRGVLAAVRDKASLELRGVGEGASVTAGLLDVALSVSPPFACTGLLQEPELRKALKDERTREAQADKAFLIYAKQWWREYLAARDVHRHRVVKVLAENEAGVSRPVSTFVTPLPAGRLLGSPRAAARFVALLHHVRPLRVGGERAEIWHAPASVLAQGAGAIHDLALLLASLFLGFGLNAYVAVGTGPAGAYTWVVTLDSPATGAGPVFWDVLSGEAHDDLTSPDTSALFATVGTLFNNTQLYANAQASDAVATTAFDVTNPDHWAAMDPDVLAASRPAARTALLPSPMDAIDAALGLETVVAARLESYRRELGLSTVWSHPLSHLLEPALATYELERLAGAAVPGNAEFQQAVRAHVPRGSVFKAFPIQFKSPSPAPIWAALLDSPVAASIIQSPHPRAKFGLRVSVATYPDAVAAVWLVIALIYPKST